MGNNLIPLICGILGFICGTVSLVGRFFLQ